MLEHVAIWTGRLEEMKVFYCAYFGGTAGEKYRSRSAHHIGFESYFVQFKGGSRLELMSMPGIPAAGRGPGQEAMGLTHLAFSVPDKAQVEALARRAAAEGRPVVLAPHQTGDGYYEACILDPDGNRVEIAALPGAEGVCSK